MLNPCKYNSGIIALFLLAWMLLCLAVAGGCIAKPATDTPPKETAATEKEGGRSSWAAPFQILAEKSAAKQWGDFSLSGFALVAIATSVRLLSGSWRSAGSNAALGIVGTVIATLLTDCTALGLLAPGGQVVAIVSRKWAAMKRMWRE